MTVEWCGTRTVEQFVVSKNLHRRRLSTGQRALIAARLATRTREETLIPDASHRAPALEVENSTTSVSAGQAAEMLNVDRATVFHAKTVLAQGTQEEISAVERGEIAPRSAITSTSP